MTLETFLRLGNIIKRLDSHLCYADAQAGVAELSCAQCESGEWWGATLRGLVDLTCTRSYLVSLDQKHINIVYVVA